jgi:hypothetical protein
MLREFSRRLKNSNSALEELTNLWVRMAVVIYFIDNPGVKITEHLPQLASITKKEPENIREILTELVREGMLIVQDDRAAEVVRERMWTLLENGELRKCFIADKDKI